MPAPQGSVPQDPRRRPDSRVLLAWLLVVGFACVVLWLGTPNFSASRSYDWLLSILHLFDPEVSIDALIWMHRLLRKSMHLIVYAILAMLAFRAAWLSFGNLLLRVALTALLVALGVALLDETRQAHYAARTGSPLDVAIDGLGAASAVVIAVLLRKRLARGRDESTQAP